jgi:hypothetical protein
MKSFKFTKQKLVVIFVLVAVGVIYLLLQSWDPSAKDIRHVILISIDTLAKPLQILISLRPRALFLAM